MPRVLPIHYTILLLIFLKNLQFLGILFISTQSLVEIALPMLNPHSQFTKIKRPVWESQTGLLDELQVDLNQFS